MKKEEKKKKKVRPVKSTKESEGVPEEELKDRGLKLQWVKFLDALIANGGDQPAAYMVAYPDVKDKNVASAAATRLLKNVNVRDELNNKLSAQKVTEEYIVDRLTGLVELHFVGKGAIVSVKALEILAKMKGLLVDTKKIAFTGDNPAVFAAPYSAERKAELDKLHAGDGKVPVRIIE